MDKLKQLIQKCKCGVYLTTNEHRDLYMTVEDRLRELSDFDNLPDIDPEIKQLMIEKNTMIELQFYPVTPIGFYRLFHWDLDLALDQALECIDT